MRGRFVVIGAVALALALGACGGNDEGAASVGACIDAEQAVVDCDSAEAEAELVTDQSADDAVACLQIGEAIENMKVLDNAVEELADLAGQRPMITRAQKSIANFKLRAGMPIGARVTLRGDRMWNFLDRLISVALPRVRDFRGVPSKSFDGRGNYTLGIKDHLIFPEVDYNKVDKSKGLNVTIVTTAENDEQAFYLLRELGMPFVRRGQSS